MDTLTRSGAGVVVDAAALGGDRVTERFEELLAAHRFVVIQRAFVSVAEAVAFLRRFGTVNESTTRVDGVVVVEDRETAEVFRSHSALPLHRDGVLTNSDVALVGIHCVAFQQVVGGRTLVSDAARALERVPPDDLAALREHGIEAMAVDCGYYRTEYEGTWSRFPAFKARPGREPSLNIGLPHAPGEPESWRVRIPDVGQQRSDEILRSLCAVLLDQQFTYFHDWEEGDMLLMDNGPILHGREAFKARSRRLANIQVLAS